MAIKKISKTEVVRQALLHALERERALPSLVELGVDFCRALRARANPAGGSIFSLELPLADPVYDESDAHAEPDAQRGLRVLVVDDVEMNCEIAAAFIRSGGHDVTCANGGAEAVAAALARDFDIIMMDVRMPGIDGLEATRQIRRIPGPRGRVPIVALTAQVFTEQVEACWAAGMNDHLAKPFTPQDLLDCVVRVAAADSSGL